MPHGLFELKGFSVQVGDGVKLGVVNLRLDLGELPALGGPKGCGKTTLLRAAVGLIEPLEGQALLKGRSAAERGLPSFRRRVVYVPEDPVLFPGTVLENLRLVFRYKAGRLGEKNFPETRARKLFEELNLDWSIRTSPEFTLTPSEKRRICLARALLIKPDVLLLDSPTEYPEDHKHNTNCRAR